METVPVRFAPDYHIDKPPRLRQILFEAVTIPVWLYGLLMLTSSWTVMHLPAGKTFVLEPRGMGRLYDIWAGLFMFVGFGVIYTLPAMAVRRSLSRLLRLIAFGMFVGSMMLIHYENDVAVVQTTTGYVFVRCIPFGSEAKSFAEIPIAHVEKTKSVTRVHIGDDPHARHVLKPVYHVDKQTTEVLAKLLDALAATGTMIEGR